MSGEQEIQPRPVTSPGPAQVLSADAAAWAGPSSSQEPGLLEYFRVLVRHRVLIAAITACALLAGLVYGWLQTPMYQGTLLLQAQADPPAYVPSLQGLDSPVNPETFYTTQLDIIRSRAVAEAVVARLTPAQRQRLLPAPGMADSLAGAIGGLWSQAVGWIGLGEKPTSGGDGAAAAPAEDAERQRRALVRLVQSNLVVFRREDSELVEIRYRAPTPELAARVANLIGEAYQATQESQRVAVSQQVHDWLLGQLEKLRAKVAESERALQQFKEEQGLLASENLEALKSTRLSGITQSLLDARAARLRAEVRYQQVQDAQSTDALVAVLDNPTIAQLRMEQGRLQASLDKLLTHYGVNAPKVQAVQAQLDAVTAQLNTEIDRTVQSIREEYQRTKQEEQRLAQTEEELNEGLRERTDEEVTLAKLEREVGTNRELYQAFQGRIKEINLAGSMGAIGIRILDRALPPGAPFTPDYVRILGIAGLLSLFGAIGLAFLIENLRRTFHTPQSVEQRLQLRGLGVVPRVALRQPATLSRLAVLEPGSEFTEALGSIRARLQVTGEEGAPQLLLVTSALPGEGKSTLSSNLASSYSQLGRTLLVDGDLRRASLSSHWQGPGLTDFALGRARLGDCISRDSLSPNLFVMGKGQAPVSPLEFFASNEIGLAFAELRKHFDRIVIDTAPVLRVSDVEMMGRYTDGAILAVQTGKTSMEAVGEAFRRLQGAYVHVLGITLTQANLKEVARYGGYVYGYRPY